MKTILYFSQGNSDKVYQAQIEAEASGFVVNFAYGRRGGTLKAGTKTKNPVTQEKAQAIFDKLIQSKKTKGYTEGSGGVAFSDLKDCGEHSHVTCQLLNPIELSEAQALCRDPQMIAQEKYDGERRLVEGSNGVIKGINRRGLYVPLLTAVSDRLQHLSQCSGVTDFLIDGEQVGDCLYVWDLLRLNGCDRRGDGTLERYRQLTTFIAGSNPSVRVAPIAISTDEKQALFARIHAQDKEGVVFKDANAPYTPARPSTGGTHLKFKFYADATVIVAAHKVDKRSVFIEGVDQDDNAVPLGAVTIPPNQVIPDVGTLIDVKYLYCYKGGSLFQPVFLRPRTDLGRVDCVERLKYKPEAA